MKVKDYIKKRDIREPGFKKRCIESSKKNIQNIIIGEMLKKIRKQEKLTQKDIANAMKTYVQAISRLENNSTNPEISTIADFVHACNNNFELVLQVRNKETHEVKNEVLVTI